MKSSLPRQFPDTAVIYVDEAGLYQCAVSAEQVRVKSTLIDVRIQCHESSPVEWEDFMDGEFCRFNFHG